MARDGEEHFFLALGGDGEAGDGRIRLAGDDHVHHRVEVHIFNHQFHAQLFRDQAGEIHINTHIFAAFADHFPRSEFRVGGDGEGVVFLGEGRGDAQQERKKQTGKFHKLHENFLLWIFMNRLYSASSDFASPFRVK